MKYALLWGFLAAMLRYLPYIGPYLAAVFPISISLAMFDGWGTALMVAVLFVTLELIVANAIEPWLYGQSMGVSEIALLVIGRVLGLSLGADRTGALQPADGVPGDAGPLCSAARVPGGHSGRRAGP